MEIDDESIMSVAPEVLQEHTEEKRKRGRPATFDKTIELGFHVDQWLWSNLEYWRNMVLEHDADLCCLVDGDEGTGKSVFGAQLGKMLDIDHSIDLNQIVFSYDDFLKKIRNIKKGKAIVYDEAGESIDRRKFNSRKSMEVLDMLRECRQRNLFLVLIIPSFYDLDFRVAVRRSRFLCHVYWTPDTQKKIFVRGHYLFYSNDKKRLLYCDSAKKQFYDYPSSMADFRATFSNTYVVDEQEYRKLKASKSAALVPVQGESSKSEEELRKESLGFVERRRERWNLFFYLWHNIPHNKHTNPLKYAASQYLKVKVGTLESRYSVWKDDYLKELSLKGKQNAEFVSEVQLDESIAENEQPEGDERVIE